MARVVESSDDDLPDIDTLLKGLPKDRVPKYTTSKPANPKENSGNPRRTKLDSGNLSETDRKANGPESGVPGLEEKKRPRKRVLNHRNDNPLLKPFPHVWNDNQKAQASPTRKAVKLRKKQDHDIRLIAKPREVFGILDSNEGDGESQVKGNGDTEEYVGAVTRKGNLKSILSSVKVKDDKVLEAAREDHAANATSMLTSKKNVTAPEEGMGMVITTSSPTVNGYQTSKKDAKVLSRRERQGESLPVANAPSPKIGRVSKSRMGLTSTFKASIDVEGTLDSEEISTFIVSGSTCLDDDDSIIPLPPPRSVRRLVKGRRPSRLHESEEESFMGKENSVDSDGSSGLLWLGKEFEVSKFLDSKGSSQPSTVDKKIRECVFETTRCSESTLVSDLEGLSLGSKTLKNSQPAKIPREQIFITPPGTPVLNPIKLKSPTKKFLPIPKSPHRPSMDSFWNVEVINEWNDQYSPQKLPKTCQLDDQDMKEGTLLFSPKKPPVKQDRLYKEAKRAFSEKKSALADSFLAELDGVLTQGQISKLSASTGGIKIIWSKKLNTTAGRANWKRETMRPPSTTGLTHRHHASIELAEKIIDDEERLLNVIAHEFCHLANFMISNVKTNPHGKEFKEWAAKCSRHFGDRGIKVTTKHSYEIDYKYVWECENCGLEFKRHSKSIDPVKHQCGSCKSRLIQMKPVPRGISAGGVKLIGEYQTFVKENMSRVREENPGSPQKDILGLVAKRYQDFKAMKLGAPELGALVLETGASKKEMTTRDSEMVKSLSVELNFLDLTSP